jgi:hypothetical protein
MYIFVGAELGQSSSTIDGHRAIEQNRKYSAQLGWHKYYDRINPLLGFPDTSPEEATFAEAVADWQQKCGLTVDGIIGSNTWSRMKAVIGLTQPGSGERVKKRGLRFKFRHNFLDFQREVEKAIGRWIVYRSDQGQRVRWLMGKCLTGDKASLSHAGQSFERIGRTKNREP